MITTYEEYLGKNKSLTVEQMEQLHKEILAEIDGDSDAVELYDELIETATRYAAMRAEWLLMSKEKKMEVDSSRTSCHNSTIIKFNMLSRYLRMQGKPAVWRDTLGYEEEDKYYRKTVGDFACYLVFINSINAR